MPKRPDWLDLDRLVKSGEIEPVRQTLRSLSIPQLLRSDRVPFAALCRRVHLAELGGQALYQTVREFEATPQEKAEYGAVLARMGAYEEADELLTHVPDEQEPLVLLYRSFALTPRWKYAETIPLLERFLDQITAPYLALVAEVNLLDAEAYLGADLPPARFEKLSQKLAGSGARLLETAVHLIEASYHVRRKNSELAFLALARAEKELPSSAFSPERIYHWKWSLFARVASDARPSPETIKQIESLRQTALEIADWETIRECDRVRAVSLSDEQLADRVYFGTPHEAYRERLEKDFPNVFSSTRDRWDIPFSNDPEAPVLDLLDPPKRFPMREGRVSFRLLVALLVERYRPLDSIALFFAAYPGDFFNPFTVPHKVAEAMRRLRQDIEKASLPLEIRQVEQGYRLAATGPITLRLHRRLLGLNDEALDRLRLREKFGREEFSAAQASSVLKGSERSNRRWLSLLVEEGWLIKTGASRSIRYRVPNPEDR